MHPLVVYLILSGAAALALNVAMGVGPATAATPVETLYQELAKLPQDQRTQRLIEGARKEEKLATIPLFNGQLERTHTKIFKDRYPWMKLETQSMNTEESVERFIAEETVGRHITDQLNVTMPDLDPLLRRDMLARYETPVVKTVLPQYRNFIDPEHRWLPWTWSEHGISYNTDIVKKADEPTSYEDLCHPRFKGQVSYDPGEPKWVVGMLQMMGEEKYRSWTKCLAGNDPIIMKGHTTRMTLMLTGDHGVQGDNFLYTGVMAKAKNSKKAPFEIAFKAPILARASVAIIGKHSAHPYGAALWSDWQLSEESQQYVFDVFRGPLTRPHAYITGENDLFVYGVVPTELIAKATEIWRENFGSKK